MRTKRTAARSEELVHAKREFRQWRRGRKRRGPIPPELWAMAAEAARIHGVTMTARHLRLNATSLRDRMPALGRSDLSQPGPCFVELPLLGDNSVAECILEAEDRSGTKLRIQLKAGATAQAATLSRMLWKGEG